MAIDLPLRDPRVHVLSVSDGGPAIPHQTYLGGTAAAGDALRDALGAGVDPAHTEVFAVADVAPMGLRDYLAQAHDIPLERLAPDAAKLDALSGDVVVLAPRAVEGVRRLEPAPHLTHVGAYAPAAVDDRPRELPPAAREPGLAEPAPRERRSGPGGRAVVWIVLAAVALAALVVVAL